MTQGTGSIDPGVTDKTALYHISGKIETYNLTYFPLWNPDLSFFGIFLLTIKNCNMTNHPHQLGCGFFFNNAGHLFFLAFFLEITKFYLDKLMLFQRLMNRPGYGRSESLLADKNHWFHSVDKALQIFLLITF
jgi:hypothetical protein